MSPKNGLINGKCSPGTEREADRDRQDDVTEEK